MRIDQNHSLTVSNRLGIRTRPAVAVLIAALIATPIAQAGTVSSGSNGSDGALNLTAFEPVVIDFDPRDTATFGRELDADGDGVYQFTSITIGPNVTLRMSSKLLGSEPIQWLSTGDVVINGKLDLSGEPGKNYDEPAVAAYGGAGGYDGGIAGRLNGTGTAGSGPGAGAYRGGSGDGNGGGAAHVSAGSNKPAYGNAYLLPLIGGSGGGGGYYNSSVLGGGGGAGGGAIMIVSDTVVTIGGAIWARGGVAGRSAQNLGGNSFTDERDRGQGGGGSGGAIRIVAPTIDGSGDLSVHANTASYTVAGSGGRIRLEAFDYAFSGTQSGSGTLRRSTPGLLNLPESAPSLRVVRVGGVDVPEHPRSFFNPADVKIDKAGDVTFELEASHIPVGTRVQLRMVSEVGQVVEFQSDFLTGSDALSTATATATIPHGFSRFSIEATWE